MDSSFALPRKVLTFAVCVGLALLVGYLLATPLELASMGLIGLIIFGLLLPVLMKWHHFLLVATWNAAITFYFLPGRPEAWILMAAIGLGFGVLNRLMSREQPSLLVPSLIWPLVFMALVVIVTAKQVGGVGIRSLGGSSYGGRSYVMILAAIAGFFALTSQRISLQKAPFYAMLFFASSVTAIISNLAFIGGPSFYWLYYLFPPAFAMQQAVSQFSVVGDSMSRLTGFALAAPALSYILLLRYGIQGILRPSKIWRMVLFGGLAFLGMLGGFRSTVIMTGLLCVILFLVERLYRTRLVLTLLLAGLIGGATLIPFVESLPIQVQRSISFLPIDVDPRAAIDARATTEWRLRIWKLLIPQVPTYFWVGKGFGMDPIEMNLLIETCQRWGSYETEATIASGSYHNGPLTLIIPLGIWGVIGFLWFAMAGLRVVYRNYRYGPPELNMINTFLLGYFIMRLIYFLLLYGHFFQDFMVFTGIVGLSVSLNGGMAKKSEEIAQPVAEPVMAELSPA
jgi:hypothetical protein